MSTNPYKEEKISETNIGFNCKTDHIVLDISWTKTPNWALHPVFNFLYGEAIMKTIGDKAIQVRISQKRFIEGTLGYLINDLLAFEKNLANNESHHGFSEDYEHFVMSLSNADQKEFEEKKAEQQKVVDDSLAEERLVKVTLIEDNVLVTFHPKIACLLDYFLDSRLLQNEFGNTHYNTKTNTYRFSKSEFVELLLKFNVPFYIDDDLESTVKRLEIAWGLVFYELEKNVLDNCLKHQLLQSKKDKNAVKLRKKLKGTISDSINRVYIELAKLYQRDVWSKDEIIKEEKGDD